MKKKPGCFNKISSGKNKKQERKKIQGFGSVFDNTELKDSVIKLLGLIIWQMVKWMDY